MILNDLERCNSPYFAFFLPNSTDCQANYITVVEDRPIMSVKCCLPLPVLLNKLLLTFRNSNNVFKCNVVNVN